MGAWWGNVKHEGDKSKEKEMVSVAMAVKWLWQGRQRGTMKDWGWWTNPSAPRHITLEGFALWSVTTATLGDTWGHIQNRWHWFFFCLGLTLRWKFLESRHKLSEVNAFFSDSRSPKGGLSVLMSKLWHFSSRGCPFGFKSQFFGFVPEPHWIHCGGSALMVYRLSLDWFQVWALPLNWPQLSHFGWRWS